MRAPLKAPFPWFGGKSRVAHLVWERFGDVPNYVEPFAGSLAVLLGRPTKPKAETVNDLDCYLSNFWRAVKFDPEEVSRWAEWQANEADLRSRHEALRAMRLSFRERMQRDPEFYDAKVAGFWVYGAALSLGETWQRQTRQELAVRHGWSGFASFDDLARRLAGVTVMCGDWRRAVTDVRLGAGPTAVLLDPPYDDDEHTVSYAEGAVARDVAVWAAENGQNPSLRIALCGYDGEHEMPSTWTVEAWKACGGYGSQGDGQGRENANRERIWFSPGCLSRRQQVLFGGTSA